MKQALFEFSNKYTCKSNVIQVWSNWSLAFCLAYLLTYRLSRESLLWQMSTSFCPKNLIARIWLCLLLDCSVLLLSIESPLISDMWPRRCRIYGLNRGCSATKTDSELIEVIWLDRQETFNKSKQTSTKPNVFAWTVGVTVECSLPSSNNSA